MGAVFGWGLVSARLERADLTAPIVFTALGAAVVGLDLVDSHRAPETLKPLVEVTLVWVLFSDAARVRVHDLRHDAGRVLRLLGVGLPLTVAGGLGPGRVAVLRPGPVAGAARRRGAGADRRGAGRPRGDQPGGAVADPSADHRRERPQRRDRHPRGDARGGRRRLRGGCRRRRPGEGGRRAGRELGVGVVGAGCVAVRRGGSAVHGARRRLGVGGLSGRRGAGAGCSRVRERAQLHGNGFVAAFCGGMAFGAAAGREPAGELVFLEQASGLVVPARVAVFGARRRPADRGPGRREPSCCTPCSA